MQRYYRTGFGVSKRQAKEAAEYYIKLFIVNIVGKTGRSSDSMYMSGCFNTQDVDAYLKTGWTLAKKCPSDKYNETSKAAILRKFWGLAIVNDYPPSVVKRLITDGAYVNSNPADDSFDTPLMLAAPYPKVMALLLEAGANVNTPNIFGKTALMYAIQEQNSESVSLLIQAHADVNAKTKTIDVEDTYSFLPKVGHRTPLMYAAWQSSPEIIRLLIQAHADITAKDTNGETAFDYLKRNKAPGVAL